MLNSTSSWNFSGRAVPAALTIAERHPPAKIFATDIRFTVSVPVLSTQSTVAEPSVSTAGTRRVSTCCLRDAPGAQRQEDGQHDRELLGQHRHRQGDAGQKPLRASRPA